LSGKELLETRIEDIFKKWNAKETPGCNLGIIRDGEFLYKGNYGLRNLVNKKLITSKTIFDIASVSKQFTAACIALLIISGKLSLNDSLNDLLPDVTFMQKIKLKHLIYQESGIRDYQYSLLILNNGWDDIESLSKKQLSDFINKLPELDFIPGNQHNYSNTNYFLLGLIVEQITGKSLKEFARQELFTPLGMKNTFFQEEFSKIKNSNLAIGYSLRDEGYVENIPKTTIIGPRGVYTTIEDLLLWDQNFYSKKVGGKEFIELIEQPSREKIVGLSTNRWNSLTQHQGYAFGLLTDFYRGLKIIRHGGDYAGYTSEMLRFPEKELTIIILTNNGSINPTTFAFKTADIILDNEIKSRSPYTWKVFRQLNEEKINALLGTYYDNNFNAYFSIYKEDNKLMLENDWMKSELKAVSDDTLIAANQPSLLHIRTKEKKIIFENEFYTAEIPKIVPISLKEEQLLEYIGIYYNEKFNQTLQITALEDTLNFDLKCGKQVIKPISKDIFRNGFLQLEFHRKNNDISFVKINSNGSKGIIYEKFM
jgi:CubicO group peptidase (beta-lactamase class C family)